MNCQDIARMLDEKEVDGLLADEQSGVQAHLATCRDCARDWHIHARLVQAELPAVPAELRARYAAQAADEGELGSRRRSRFVVIGTFVALAAAAGMLVLPMSKSPASVTGAVDPVQVDAVRAQAAVKQGLPEVLPLLKETLTEDRSRAELEWTRRVAEWLAVRDDPDSLITAALLLFVPERDDQRIQSLLQRATALAPDSARIHAIALQLCAAEKPCDATPYEQALRRIAPDNALGWAEELKRASQADDQEALQNALAAMSRAKTFDLYWNASIVSITSRIRSAIVTPPDISGFGLQAFSEMDAVGAIAAMPTAYAPITKFCKSATDERAVLQCRQIGAAMRAGDTVMANSLGTIISGYGLAADSVEASLLAQEKNRIRWISVKQDLIAGDPRFLRLLTENPREIDALRAYLEDQGIPTEPPANWKP